MTRIHAAPTRGGAAASRRILLIALLGYAPSITAQTATGKQVMSDLSAMRVTPTGGTATDLGGLLAGTVNVKEKRFAGGAKGDGVTDDTAAIQAAAAVARGGLMFPPGSYMVHGRADLLTGVHVYLHGATITQTANATPIFKASSQTDIVIEGGTLVGVGASDTASTANSAYWTDTPSNQAFALFFQNCQRVTVRDVTMSAFRGGGIALHGNAQADIHIGPRVKFSGTYPEAGLPAGDTNYAQFGVHLFYDDWYSGAVNGQRIVIEGVDASDTAISFYQGPGFDEVTYRDLTFARLSQHGLYIVPHTNLTISGITGDAYAGSKIVAQPGADRINPSKITVDHIKMTSSVSPAFGVWAIDELSGSLPVRSGVVIQGLSLSKFDLSSTGNVGLVLGQTEDASINDGQIHDTATGQNGITGYAFSGTIENVTLRQIGGNPIEITAAPYRTARIARNFLDGAAAAAGLIVSEYQSYSAPIAWSTGNGAGGRFFGAGVYVTNGTNVYLSRASGMSVALASGGPTGTGTGITDGAVTWDYVAAAASVDKSTHIIEHNVYAARAGDAPVKSLILSGTQVHYRGNRLGTAPLQNSGATILSAEGVVSSALSVFTSPAASGVSGNVATASLTAEGEVWLAGYVNSSSGTIAANTVLVTLDAAYRPSRALTMPVLMGSTNAMTYLTIATNGDVAVGASVVNGGAYVRLDNVRFRLVNP